jgi:HK97 family phage major capsid protein
VELEQQIMALLAEQKAFIARADTEFKTNGTMHKETKAALDTIVAQRTAMQTQLDALDAAIAQRHHTDSPVQVKSLGAQFVEHKNYLERKATGFRGMGKTTVDLDSSAFPAFMQRKTNITDTGLGFGTTGILMPAYLGGPIVLAKQALRIRNIMPATPLTTGSSFFYATQNVRTNAASPQVEAVTKAESTYGWTTITDHVRTIAHFTNVSRQALDDIQWMRNQIDTELMYGLLLKEEAEILAGSGTGEHLNGLITQSTAYLSGTYNVTGDTNLDILRSAKLQARLAGLATFAPSAYVLHPTDMARIEKIKTAQSGPNTGLYIIGDPKTGPAIKMLWDLPVVESDSITAGTFLVGAFDTAVELIDRMAATVDISYEHASNFTANLATILCEERIGLAVKRPNAFITGSLPNGLV